MYYIVPYSFYLLSCCNTYAICRILLVVREDLDKSILTMITPEFNYSLKYSHLTYIIGSIIHLKFFSEFFSLPFRTYWWTKFKYVCIPGFDVLKNKYPEGPKLPNIKIALNPYLNLKKLKLLSRNKNLGKKCRNLYCIYDFDLENC